MWVRTYNIIVCKCKRIRFRHDDKLSFGRLIMHFDDDNNSSKTSDMGSLDLFDYLGAWYTKHLDVFLNKTLNTLFVRRRTQIFKFL